MVDETLILRKLTQLEEYVSQIAQYRSITLEQYRDDWKIQRIIERTLQMMIETCVDIAGHIILCASAFSSEAGEIQKKFHAKTQRRKGKETTKKTAFRVFFAGLAT